MASDEKREYKVGDVIVGNSKASARYGYTKEGWVGKVIETNGLNENGEQLIRVEGLGIGVNKTHTGPYPLISTYFDPYVKPSKKDKRFADEGTSVALSDMTNAEVYKTLFGFRHASCPSSSCDACPGKHNCSKGQAWWDLKFSGKMQIFYGTMKTRPTKKDDQHKPTKKKGLAGLCEEYNYSDYAGLVFMANNDLCEKTWQKKELEALFFLNELLFVHNSETYSPELYRSRYTHLLMELGIKFDDEGYAYLEKKEGDSK